MAAVNPDKGPNTIFADFIINKYILLRAGDGCGIN